MKRALTVKQKQTRDRHNGILGLYITGQYTTERIAKVFGVTPRQVQRLASKNGVIRTISESNKLMAKLKDYSGHRVPAELKRKRKSLTVKQRYEVLVRFGSTCVMCGATPDKGVRVEVDHIDENPSNNEPANLQVLCRSCNSGKSHFVASSSRIRAKGTAKLLPASISRL